MSMKRVLDLVVVALTLPVWLPLLLVIGLLVLTIEGRPILFSQERPGRKNQLFVLRKFRTMTNRLDSDGSPLPDASRLTGFGRWLRASSLDELPEVWNVICGEMSLVGPRPLLVEYLPLYDDTDARRHEVAPGITGWAQVNGRNAITWAEKFRLDVWYVDHQSFALDVQILIRTLALVFRRHGINAPGEATMQRYSGRPRRGPD